MGLVAIFSIGMLSAPNALASPALMQDLGRSSVVSPQGTQPGEVSTLCLDSQVWRYTTINGYGLWPCDGVYINCWTYDANGFLWVWVSWTSRYYWNQQGWVDDYSIDTGNATTIRWPHC